MWWRREEAAGVGVEGGRRRGGGWTEEACRRRWDGQSGAAAHGWGRDATEWRRPVLGRCDGVEEAGERWCGDGLRRRSGWVGGAGDGGEELGRVVDLGKKLSTARPGHSK